MASRAYKFHVSGETEEGDLWTFSTNDEDRARDVHADMQEDFETVEFKGK